MGLPRWINNKPIDASLPTLSWRGSSTEIDRQANVHERSSLDPFVRLISLVVLLSTCSSNLSSRHLAQHKEDHPTIVLDNCKWTACRLLWCALRLAPLNAISKTPEQVTRTASCPARFCCISKRGCGRVDYLEFGKITPSCSRKG